MAIYTGTVSLSGPGTFSVKNYAGQVIHSGVTSVTFTKYQLPIYVTCTEKIEGTTGFEKTGDYTAILRQGYLADLKIYTAKWTVRFYSDIGGTLLKSQTVLNGNSATAPSNPTKTGYAFTSWDKSFTNITSDLDVYAQWSVKQYTATFDANGGTGGTTVTQDYGTSLTAPTVTRTGYTLTGWSPEVPETMPARNKTYVAQWEPNQYLVLFNQWYGTGGSEIAEVTYDQSMPSATMPTRTGYTFGGYYTVEYGGGTQYYNANGTSARNWDIDESSTILFAKWTPIKTTFSFNQQSGSGGTTSVTATYDSPMPSIALPTRTGYIFGGYFTAVNGGGTKYYNADGTSAKNCDKTSATLLYAKWTGMNVTVSLNRQSGSGGSSSVTATFGQSMPSIALPTRTGYIFGGYYTEANGGGTQYYTDTGASARNMDRTSATLLYAKWTPFKAALSFNQQSGGGGTTSTTVTYDSPMPSITLPTRSGYIFDGYFTAENGGGTQYYTAAGASARNWDRTENTVLYAKWLQSVTVNMSAMCSDNEGEFPQGAGSPMVRIGSGSWGGQATAAVVEGDSVKIYAYGVVNGLNFARFAVVADGVTIPTSEVETESTAGNGVKSASFMSVRAAGGISVVAYYDRFAETLTLGVGTASASAGVTESAISASPSANLKFGDTVALSADTPASSCHFYGWGPQADRPNNLYSSDAEYAIVLGSLVGTVNVYAHYARQVNVVVKSYNAGGAEVTGGGIVNVYVFGQRVADPSNAFLVPLGATMRVIVSAASGFFFAGIDYTENGATEETNYGAGSDIPPKGNGTYTVKFMASLLEVYLACDDEIETGASGTAGVTTASYNGTESGAFIPVEASSVTGIDKTGVSANAHWYKVRQGLTVELAATKATGSGALEWKSYEVSELPEASESNAMSLLDANPASASSAWSNSEFTVQGHTLVKTTWGVYEEPKVVIAPQPQAGGRAVFVGEPPDQYGRDVHEKKFKPDQGVYKTTTVRAIEDPAGGYMFAGWFRDDGTCMSTDKDYTFEVTADVKLIAAFSPDDNSVFAWEGAKSNKTMEWTSGILTVPRPQDPVAVRVDAAEYPVAATVQTHSSPDAEVDRMHEVDVLGQSARRLPRMRPERFWQVSLRANVEIDAVVVSTNMTEAN